MTYWDNEWSGDIVIDIIYTCAFPAFTSLWKRSVLHHSGGQTDWRCNPFKQPFSSLPRLNISSCIPKNINLLNLMPGPLLLHWQHFCPITTDTSSYSPPVSDPHTKSLSSLHYMLRFLINAQFSTLSSRSNHHYKCSRVQTCAVGRLVLVFACQFVQLPVSIKSGLQRCHWIPMERRGSRTGDGTGVPRCLDWIRSDCSLMLRCLDLSLSNIQQIAHLTHTHF